MCIVAALCQSVRFSLCDICTRCCAFVTWTRALDFYCNKLGMKETRRRVDEKNRYTLVFLAGPEDERID